MACCTCTSTVTADPSARGLTQRPSRFSRPLTLVSPIRPLVLAETPTAGRQVDGGVAGARLHLHAVALRRHAAEIEVEIAGAETDGQALEIEAAQFQLRVTGAQGDVEIEGRVVVEAQGATCSRSFRTTTLRDLQRARAAGHARRRCRASAPGH